MILGSVLTFFVFLVIMYASERTYKNGGSNMFEYTRAFGQKLVNDCKTANYLFNVISPLTYILYLIYAIFVPVGYMWANIPLLAITLTYLVFYLCTYDLKNKKFKETKRNIKHIYKGVKLFISALTLVITFYGIYTATTHTTTLSIVLSCFMALFWIVSTATELITYIVEYEWSLFLASIEADTQKLMKPLTATKDFFVKAIGREPEPPKEPKKILRVLDKTIEKMREAKKNKKSKGNPASESTTNGENNTNTEAMTK